jgi:hypothetical protein
MPMEQVPRVLYNKIKPPLKLLQHNYTAILAACKETAPAFLHKVHFCGQDFTGKNGNKHNMD